jgi:6-phosphogluconolactonase
MTTAEHVVLSDAAAVTQEAARRLLAIADDAIAQRGAFTVALAGGSSPASLYRLLAAPSFVHEIDWPHSHIYFGDERCVPPDHPDSNFKMAQEALLARVPLPAANVFRMAGELPPEMAAQAYAQIIRSNFHLSGTARPCFDLILLGMGHDGHTASLFPGMSALDERRRPVVGSDVPAYVQPAVPRITVTFPVLNAARNVLFLVTGANKAAAVRAVWGNLQPGELLPAARVQPANGRLVWLLDSSAAAGLRSI